MKIEKILIIKQKNRIIFRLRKKGVEKDEKLV